MTRNSGFRARPFRPRGPANSLRRRPTELPPGTAKAHSEIAPLVPELALPFSVRIPVARPPAHAARRLARRGAGIAVASRPPGHTAPSSLRSPEARLIAHRTGLCYASDRLSSALGPRGRVLPVPLQRIHYPQPTLPPPQ